MSETATFAPAAEHASPVPLTPAQGRRLVMEWAEAGGPVLDEPLAVLLVHGGLDPDALAGAVRRLVAAHPALRTTVEETAAGWVQRIHDRLDPELVEYDAAGRDVDAVLDDLLAAHRTTRLDPYHGPVLRVVRARLAADRELLVVLDEAVLDHQEDGVKHIWVFDNRVKSNPISISTFPVPDEFDYVAKGGHFGPHNVYENRPDGFRSSELIFATYQNAGVRVYDIRNPYRPEEVAVFVPPEPEKLMDRRPNRKKVIQLCDVNVTKDGLVFVNDYNGGLYIFEYEG